MQFAFMDKGKALSTCVSLSGKMQLFDETNMHNLLRSKYVAEDFNQD